MNIKNSILPENRKFTKKQMAFIKNKTNINFNHKYTITNHNKTQNKLMTASSKSKEDKKLKNRTTKEKKEKKLQKVKSNDSLHHDLFYSEEKKNRGFLSEVVNRYKIKFLIIKPRKKSKNEIVTPKEKRRISSRTTEDNKKKKKLMPKNIVFYKKEIFDTDKHITNSNNSNKNNLNDKNCIYIENPLILDKQKVTNTKNHIIPVSNNKTFKNNKKLIYEIPITNEKNLNIKQYNLTNLTTVASTQPSTYKNKETLPLNFFPKHVFTKDILNNINISNNNSSNNLNKKNNNKIIAKSLSNIKNDDNCHKINKIKKHYLSNNNNCKFRNKLLIKNKNESEKKKNINSNNNNNNKNNIKKKIRKSNTILPNDGHKINNSSNFSNKFHRVNSSILSIKKHINNNFSACVDNVKNKFAVINIKKYFNDTILKIPNINIRNSYTSSVGNKTNNVNICHNLNNSKQKNQNAIIKNKAKKSKNTFNLINIEINNNNFKNSKEDFQCKVAKTENKLSRCKKSKNILNQNNNFEILNNTMYDNDFKKYINKKERLKKSKYIFKKSKKEQENKSNIAKAKNEESNKIKKQNIQKLEKKSDNHLFNVYLIKRLKKTNNKNGNSYHDLSINIFNKNENHSMHSIPRKIPRNIGIISRYYTTKSIDKFITKSNIIHTKSSSNEIKNENISDILVNNVSNSNTFYNKKCKEFKKYIHHYQNIERYSLKESFKLNKFVKKILPKNKVEKILLNNLSYKYNRTEYNCDFKTNKNSLYCSNQNEKNESQIPIVAEENTNRISLKIIKYNECTFTNQYFVVKLFEILSKPKILNIFLSYLTKEDLFHLSITSNFFNDICIHKINQIIFKKIVLRDNKEIIKKIWKIDLIKNSILHKKTNQIEKIYTENLKNSKYDKEIIKDLSRTFPDDNSFKKESDNYKKLFNVLKAYSNYNKKIGYVQGMNFIAAKLILFFKNEKDIFIQLDSLLNKLNFSGVIGIINKELNLKMKILQILLDKLNPKISQLMKNKKIDHDTFTASWIITLFSKNFENNKLLLKIWTFTLIYGWKFIYLFIISIFECFQDKCEKYEMFEFVQFMKNLFQMEEFNMNFQKIIKMTFNYMSKWKNIVRDINSFLK